jgi:hypothetical protein
MAMNLVTTIMQSLTPDMIAKIASLLGIDRGVAEKAISAGIPAILASFANLASSPDGARQLSSTLTQQSTGGFDAVKAAIGSGQRNVADSGTSLLSGLIGNSGLTALAAALGSFAGTGTNTGKSLLGMLGPLVAGTLGQQQRSSGLDASGLASLLTSQKDQIAGAMPPAFAKMLSGTDVLGAFSGAGGRVAGMAGDMATGTREAAYAASRSGSAPSTWPYWAIAAALIALVGIGWYALTDHEGPQVAEQKTAPATQTSPTVGARTPDATAADITTELSSSVSALRTTLQGITNQETARAALPQLKQAVGRLDRINVLASQLPPTARQSIAASLAPALAPLNQLFDKALASPEVAGIAKPTIDALRARFEALSRA